MASPNPNMPRPIERASTPSTTPTPVPSQSAPESGSDHKRGQAKEKGLQINGFGTFEQIESGGTAIQFNGLKLQDEVLLKILEMQMKRN